MILWWLLKAVIDDKMVLKIASYVAPKESQSRACSSSALQSSGFGSGLKLECLFDLFFAFLAALETVDVIIECPEFSSHYL